jgi:hypothetical protein
MYEDCKNIDDPFAHRSGFRQFSPLPPKQYRNKDKKSIQPKPGMFWLPKFYSSLGTRKPSIRHLYLFGYASEVCS